MGGQVASIPGRAFFHDPPISCHHPWEAFLNGGRSVTSIAGMDFMSVQRVDVGDAVAMKHMGKAIGDCLAHALYLMFLFLSSAM